MIQRIQTVWLFLIALLNAGMLLLPIVRGEAVEFSRGFLDAEAGIAVLLAVTTIFLYKRRPLQVKCCYGLLLLQVAWYASLYLAVPAMEGDAIFATAWNFPVLFPLISLVSSGFAIRAIQKDEKLVRSLDRIR
jgi:hypothetical protein